MSELPTWLGIIVTTIVIASALGTAVAVYRTSLQGAALAEERRRTEGLRGEISDYQRREAQLEEEVATLKGEAESCARRVTVLEDLVTKRSDDAEIRAGIAELKASVDREVIGALKSIETLLIGQAT